MLLSLRVETLYIRPIGVIKGCSNYPLYVPIGKSAKPVPFQGTDTGSNPVGGTRPRMWNVGLGDIRQVKLQKSNLSARE